MIATNDFKKRIYEAYDESERLSQKAKFRIIVKGSDEHLDMISEKKPGLDNIVTVLRSVNDIIENNFPSNDITEAKEIKKLLHMLHSSVKLFSETMGNIEFYAASFPEALGQLNDEINQLEEYIQDINEYVLSEDNPISDDLMDSLHGL